MIFAFLFSFAFSSVHHNKEQHIYISSLCVKKTEWTNCQALTALRYRGPLDIYNGVEPGTHICKRVEGKVYYQVDDKGNMRSVCTFNDESWVDLGTLEYYVIPKKDVPLNP